MSEVLFERFSNLETFELDAVEYSLKPTGSMHVAEGVRCDTYAFEGNDTCDLGIILLDKGAKTPLQRVLAGDRTIERHLAGLGILEVMRTGEAKPVQHFVAEIGDRSQTEVEVGVGDVMQWRTYLWSPLVVAEVCYPPYTDGRFENLT